MNDYEQKIEQLEKEILQLKEEKELLLNSLQESIGFPKTHFNEEEQLNSLHQLLFSISLQGIVYQDANDQILDANPVALKILGLTLDQLQGKSSYDPRWKAIHEDGSPFQAEQHPSVLALKSGKIITNVIMGVFNPIDNKNHWIKISSIPVIKEGATKPYMVYTVFDDISELKETEQALLDSELRYKNIIQILPEGLVIHNQDKIIYANESALRILNAKDISELLGKSPLSFVHPDEIYKSIKRIEEGINELHLVEAIEQKLICCDGQIKECITRGLAIDFMGQKSMLVIFHDISERKKIEYDLENEKLRLSYILKGTNVGTWEWNIQTGKTVYSERWAEIIGYTLDEIENNTINTWIKYAHPDDIIVSNQLIEKHFSGELDYYEFESRMKHKNGSWVWVLDRGRVYKWDENGNPLMMAGTHQDITQRKLFEQELIESKNRAIESDKLKTAFLQNISHEIRTPLNGILGFANLLSESSISKDDIIEYTKIMNKSGQRLLEIINNILDMSKIETGQFNIYNCDFSINSIIHNLYYYFVHYTSVKGLQLRYHCGLDDSNSIIHSDSTKITQILTNLLKNAIKFTNYGEVEFGYEIKNNKFVFFVKDTGIGISAEYNNSIFERFMQIDQTANRAFEGAGLGLAISKGLVELLGGRIWYESELNVGTNFYFELELSSFDLNQKIQTPNFN